MRPISVGSTRKTMTEKTVAPKKRGRGTAKDVVLGAVERGGQVVAKLVPNATGETIKDFIKSIVNTDESELITDGYRGYNEIGKQMKHEILNRSQQWGSRGHPY